MKRPPIPVVVAVVVAMVISGFTFAVATDAIRLGPASYDLPTDAMNITVQVRWLGQSLNSTVFDVYSLLITVVNHVTDGPIQAYGVDVGVAVPNGTFVLLWPAMAVYSAYQPQVTLVDGTHLELPAGLVTGMYDPQNLGQGTSTLEWRVQGDSSSGDVPVMEYEAQFYIEQVYLPKGTILHEDVRVTLTWDYHGPIQTYPVASRTTVVGYVMRSG